MKQLNYQVLEEAGYRGYLLKDAPVKVMQFGEGNFLRAFAEYWLDLANEAGAWNGKVLLVQPVGGGDLAKRINRQEGLYTLYLRGSENGRRVDRRRVISCVDRCLNPADSQDFDTMMRFAKSDELELIVSNTTEAGIQYDPACRLDDRPAASFPGKLTQVLYRRFQAEKPGLVILACELIDENGKELNRCVNQYIDQWGLPETFRRYVNEACLFCGSLVDRIVPGRIRDPEEVRALCEENGYEDQLMDVGEVFGIWVIEGPEGLEDRLPFKRAGLSDKVFVVQDMSPYKKRKVRILNGAHTGFALGSYLAGKNIVRECIQDDTIRAFMNKMLYEEVIPTLTLDQDDLMTFAGAVRDRFDNPFVDHQLLSISLNSTSKWKARNMPSFLTYIQERKALPKCLTLSLAACIAFYSNDLQELTDAGLTAKRPAGDTYMIGDDRWILEFYWERKDWPAKALVHAVLANERMWGQDLTKIDGVEEAVSAGLELIREKGAKAAFASCLSLKKLSR